VTPAELRAWRQTWNYATQAELARALGLQPLAVTRWENGTRKMPTFLPLALETLARRRSADRQPATAVA